MIELANGETYGDAAFIIGFSLANLLVVALVNDVIEVGLAGADRVICGLGGVSMVFFCSCQLAA